MLDLHLSGGHKHDFKLMITVKVYLSNCMLTNFSNQLQRCLINTNSNLLQPIINWVTVQILTVMAQVVYLCELFNSLLLYSTWNVRGHLFSQQFFGLIWCVMILSYIFCVGEVYSSDRMIERHHVHVLSCLVIVKKPGSTGRKYFFFFFF